MAMWDGLRTWRALRRERPALETPEVQGGREAELILHELVTGRFQRQGAHLFAGRRVPCPARRMRREIDLIVLTPKLVSLIEVKNWSGELHDHGAVWLQVRRGGFSLWRPGVEFSHHGPPTHVLGDGVRSVGNALRGVPGWAERPEGVPHSAPTGQPHRTHG